MAENTEHSCTQLLQSGKRKTEELTGVRLWSVEEASRWIDLYL